MFWRFGGYASISTIDTVLDKADVTVEELLDESDLIQELKQQNSKLIEFLRNELVLKKLLDYVTTKEPPGDAESGKGKEEEQAASPGESKDKERTSGISFFGKGKGRSRSKSLKKEDSDGQTEDERKEAQRKKYAYVACEVLSSEVWSITEAILEHKDDLRNFWQYLHRPAPLDPLQAGYFTKVNESLLDKKTEEMLAFFKSLDGIVPAMLQHVDCPMVMDLLLKIISLEKHEGGAGIVDWLQQQRLVPLLLSCLSPEHNSATQTSAGDFLKAIITISANATTQDQSVIGPNELTRQLVSEECIKTLISDMLRGGNPLTVGVGIIIEVIRKNNSDYDLDNQAGPEPKTSDPIYLGTLLRQFASHVPDFMHLIRSRSAKKQDLKAAFGGKIEPLGFDRFKTCELMAELLHCSNMALLNERGAEEEVSKRDAQRERLKSEGKLATPKAPSSPSHEESQDDFGSSVDSHGFHHARLSDDDMSEKPEEVRKLEVQNGSDEDGFEKVTAPDDLPDEVSFEDLNEKADHSSLPRLEKVEKKDLPSPQPKSPVDEDVPKPLSPLKPKPNLYFDPPPTQAADSPTTSGVTEKIDKLDVDEDIVMTEFGEERMDSDEDGPTELEKELAKHPEDKPAPLFARKEPSPPDAVDPVQDAKSSSESGDIDQSIATIQGEQSTMSNGERAAYETEADGKPVVGDMLKIRFVEYQVVPTILDFFFRFAWNNFLHNVVYDVVQQVFNGTLDRGYNRTIAFDLFTPVEPREGESADDLGLASTKDITDRILDGQQASDISQKEKGMRLGYMGHLTLIAEEVCKFGNRHPPEALDQVVMDRVNREPWVQYVEGTLAETRDKDNAVLGGVRPQDSIGVRQMGGLGGGFSSGAASSGLASAGIAPADTLAMSEGTVGQSFEINSGTMLSGFGDGSDDDEEMDLAGDLEGDSGGDGGQKMLDDDEQKPIPFTASPEQTSRTATTANTDVPSIPPPLNIPPSRARRQLAARLAAKKEGSDPDAADSVALAASEQLPEEPSEREVDLAPKAESEIVDLNSGLEGLQITGLRVGSTGSGVGARLEGLLRDHEEDMGALSEGSDDDVLSHLGVEGSPRAGEFGADIGVRRTSEAKERRLLSDSDEEAGDDAGGVVGGGGASGFVAPKPPRSPFEDPDDSSEEDELVEIRPRRTS